MLVRVHVGDGAAARHRRARGSEQLASRDEDAGRAGPADELVRREEDRVLVVERGVRPRPVRYISISTYGAGGREVPERQRAVPVQQDARWRACRVTMPVTFDAAEKQPILSGRSAYAHELRARGRARSTWPSASSWIVDDVGDRLAPRQLVGVVLERADEHDRPLARAGSAVDRS